MRYLPLALLALTFAAPAPAVTLAAASAAPAPVTAAPALPPASAAPAVEGAEPAEEVVDAGPPSWIYMVVRVKLTDTDITQVAFLRHPAITTLEACEAERTAGMMSGWRYYNRYYFKTLKGISYKIDFRCVDGLQYLAPWRPGDLQNRYYLVRTAGGNLDAQPQDSFFACRRALHKVSAEESIDAFCGVASQPVTEPPAEPVEPEATPDPAAPAPGVTPDTPPLPPPAPTAAGALPWSSGPAR